MPSSKQALFQPFPMLPGKRAQVWRHQPSFRRPRHFHAEPEVNLVVRGSASLGVGDNVVSLGAGELFLFRAGQDHELLEASADLELFVFALRPELAARLDSFARRPASGEGRLSAAELDRVVEKLTDISDIADGGAIELGVSELFQSVQRSLNAPHVLSRRAATQLQADPAVSARKLAAQLNASPSDVSRRFHGDLGVRLVDYRARLRLMRFVRCVDSGQDLIEAALNADFGSYAQCHRVFQRFLRCAPQRYFAGARRELDELLELGA